MSSLVPNRFLLDVEFPLRYREATAPRKAGMEDWDDRYRVPDLCLLDGQTPFAKVYAAWNEQGLVVAARVENKHLPPSCDPKTFWKSDHLRLCTDMRDVRDARRASRFCQMFWLMPAGGGPRGDTPVGGSHPLQRARENAPSVQPGRLRVAGKVSRGGYEMEAHLPADCLRGWDPTEHARIGFYYMLEDRELGQQYLTVGDELFWFVDPSTWATAVLTR